MDRLMLWAAMEMIVQNTRFNPINAPRMAAIVLRTSTKVYGLFTILLCLPSMLR